MPRPSGRPLLHALPCPHAFTLSDTDLDPSTGMLTDRWGMSLAAEDGDRARFGMSAGTSGALVEVQGNVRDRGL